MTTEQIAESAERAVIAARLFLHRALQDLSASFDLIKACPASTSEFFPELYEILNYHANRYHTGKTHKPGKIQHFQISLVLRVLVTAAAGAAPHPAVGEDGIAQRQRHKDYDRVHHYG